MLCTLKYTEEIIENCFDSSLSNLIAERYYDLETENAFYCEQYIEDLRSVCAGQLNKQHDCGEQYYNILTQSYKVKSMPSTGIFLFSRFLLSSERIIEKEIGFKDEGDNNEKLGNSLIRSPKEKWAI